MKLTASLGSIPMGFDLTGCVNSSIPSRYSFDKVCLAPQVRRADDGAGEETYMVLFATDGRILFSHKLSDEPAEPDLCNALLDKALMVDAHHLKHAAARVGKPAEPYEDEWGHYVDPDVPFQAVDISLEIDDEGGTSATLVVGGTRVDALIEDRSRFPKMVHREFYPRSNRVFLNVNLLKRLVDALESGYATADEAIEVYLNPDDAKEPFMVAARGTEGYLMQMIALEEVREPLTSADAEPMDGVSIASEAGGEA